MAFQSAPDMAEASVIWTCNAQRCTMTFGFVLPTGYDQGDIDQLALAMDVWAVNEFVPSISNQVTYEGVEVRGLESITDLFSFVDTNSQVGSIASAPMANHSCLSVKRFTGFTGRSARGRVYFPLTVSMIDATNEDLVGTAFVSAIEDALNEVVDVDGGVNWIHCIISRRISGVLRTEAFAVPVFGYTAVDNEIDTQRRRMGGK